MGQALLKIRAILICYKVMQLLLQNGQSFVLQSEVIGVIRSRRYYKGSQTLLQSGTGITKQGNFYYKKGQHLR